MFLLMDERWAVGASLALVGHRKGSLCSMRRCTLLLCLLVALAFGTDIQAQEAGQIQEKGMPRDRGLFWNAAFSTDLVYSYDDAAQITQADTWEHVANALGSGFYGGATTLSLGFQGGDRDSAQLVGLIKLFVPYGVVAFPLSPAGSPVPLGLELSKLYVTLSFSQADLSFGRMIVNYGKGRLFSPSDLFSAVNLQDQALGRLGTDVIRLQLPLSDLAGLDFVGTLVLPPERAVFGSRVYASLGGWDFSAMIFQNNGGLAGLQTGILSHASGPGSPAAALTEGALIGGIDLKGDLILGLYGEALLSIPYDKYQLVLDRSSFSVVLGTDYSFGATLFWALEYQGNFGSGNPVGQFKANSSMFTRLSWKLDDWTSTAGHLIYTADTQTWQANLSLNRNLMGRTSLVLYTSASHGDVRRRGAQISTEPISLALGLTLRAVF